MLIDKCYMDPGCGFGSGKGVWIQWPWLFPSLLPSQTSSTASRPILPSYCHPPPSTSSAHSEQSSSGLTAGKPEAHGSAGCRQATHDGHKKSSLPSECWFQGHRGGEDWALKCLAEQISQPSELGFHDWVFSNIGQVYILPFALISRYHLGFPCLISHSDAREAWDKPSGHS